MDPVILFFALGLFAGLAKSDLRMPPAIYDLLSMVLLLTIGLKGGVELAKAPMGGLLPQVLAVLAIGFVLPLVLFPIARLFGRVSRADAASLAAHYGSVSVATFAVGIAFLIDRNVAYDSRLPLFLVLLEVPAIIVGILIATPTAYALARFDFVGKAVGVRGLLATQMFPAVASAVPKGPRRTVEPSTAL